MRAAAFDLSSMTGWAAWDGTAAAPVLGKKRILDWGVDDGRMIEGWRRWLGHFFEQHQPEVVGIEAVAQGTHTDVTTTDRQAFIRGMLLWACHVKQVPVYQMAPSAWRKTFIGFGAGPRAPRGQPKLPPVNWKALAKQRCRLLDWDFDNDHNAAEAGGVLHHLLVMELRASPPWLTNHAAFLPLLEKHLAPKR